MSDQSIITEEPVASRWAALIGRLDDIDRGKANFALLSILLVIALLPVAATPIPAMVDYVNHLARMYVLAADGTAAASPFYRVHWALYPNLAMDLVVPPLGRVIGVETATRVFLLTSQILIVTGSMALERVVKGRFAFAGYVALMMLYSVPFAWGFVNFEFALGLALWGIAFWLTLSERGWAVRFAAHTVVVALLFVSHLFALGLYGVTLGLHELWKARAHRVTWTSLVSTMAMLAAPAALLLGLMHASGGSVGQSGSIWFLAMKPFWLFATLNGYSVWVGALGSTLLGFLLHALIRQRALRFSASGGWLLAGFGVLYLVIPSRMLDTAFVDLRVIVAAALIMPAFITLTLPSATWRFGLLGAALVIIAANVATAASNAISYDAIYKAMIASFGEIEKGSRVLVAQKGAGEDPPLGDLSRYPMYHAPTLAVHYAGAFVPTLFTTAGKQPIEVRPAYRDLAASCAGPVPIDLLKQAMTGHEPADVPDFVRRWPETFDYVYVLGPPEPSVLPSILTIVRSDSQFTLYRISRPAKL